MISLVLTDIAVTSSKTQGITLPYDSYVCILQ